MTNIPRISGLHEIADNYDAILCDVWGVLHNGITPWAQAMEALSNFHDKGGIVVMITNAPRPAQPVLAHLKQLGVPMTGVFDEVVTSGDATRDLIEQFDGPIHYLGPERDKSLFEGLDLQLVDWQDADAVVCTGLKNDTTDTPESYHDLLAQFHAAKLPFICANPDIVVEKGDKVLFCAGALARDYAAIGGETRIVGKPHKPIYDLAISRIESISGKSINRSRILAIGDGMPTDILGAQKNDLAALFISAGIHSGEYGELENPDRDPNHEKLQQFLQLHNATPVAYLPRLAP
ncbi:MAG: TIGR01459 family HAD-type hydrolase [Rhizobiaceae bacterium]|nr:TIGR01459 family HAD-type hydrolase [Rhizobiaceae bacterium]